MKKNNFKDLKTRLQEDFFEAAWCGDTKTVVQLTKENPYLLGVRDASGASALHEAAAKCKFTTVQALVDRGADVNAVDRNGNTPLSLAFNSADLKSARYLIEKGSNPNYRDGDGWTALHWAVYRDSPEIIQLLLERTVDVTIKDKKNLTALDIAHKEGLHHLMPLLERPFYKLHRIKKSPPGRR